MTPQDAHEKYAEQANTIQQKFTPFFIGLTFSILALSVQHPITIENAALRFTELVGWIALLVSGITGLRHFQWRQLLYSNLSKSESSKGKKEEYMKMKAQGLTTIPDVPPKPERPIDEVIEVYVHNEKTTKDAADILDNRQVAQATLQRRAFYIGIVALVIARGWGHVVFIYSAFQ